MLHEKVGKHGTRNTGRYQVAQSWLNRFYLTEIARMWNFHLENLSEAKKINDEKLKWGKSEL